MHYFRPVLEPAELLAQQVEHEDKLGGLPFGLPLSHWPKCNDCGKPQSLLAQFAHHPKRLNLGKAGRVLNVFQCNHDPGMCSTWEGGSGANACVITEPEESTGTLTQPPLPYPLTEREVRVVEWQELEDGIGAEDAACYFDAESYYELPRLRTEDIQSGTRLGGVPHWIQSPSEAPAPPWRFVGQLDSTYSFYRPPSGSVNGIYADPEKWEGRTHYCEGPNFGDGGIGYLFIQHQGDRAIGFFFWQCG